MIRKIAGLAAVGLLLFFAAGIKTKADKVLPTEDITVSAVDMGDPSTTVIGQPLAYPKGRPVMKAFKITIPPGKSTSLHLHEVSIFAYVLAGTLEVDYGTKGKRRFAPGQGFLEAVGWCHRGTAVSKTPVVLLALYLGSPALKNTVTCKS